MDDMPCISRRPLVTKQSINFQFYKLVICSIHSNLGQCMFSASQFLVASNTEWNGKQDPRSPSSFSRNANKQHLFYSRNMQFYCHSMEPFTIYLLVRYNGQGLVHLSNMREDKWTEHLQDAGSTELAFKATVDLPSPPAPSPNSWEDMVWPGECISGGGISGSSRCLPGPSTALHRPEWPLPKPRAAPVTDHPSLLLRHPGPWSAVLSLRTYLVLVQHSVYCWHHINLHSAAKETRSPGTEKPSLKSGNPGSQSSTRGPPGWTRAGV